MTLQQTVGAGPHERRIRSEVRWAAIVRTLDHPAIRATLWGLALIGQAALTYVGYVAVAEDSTEKLLGWCVLGSGGAVLIALALWALSKRPERVAPPAREHPAMRRVMSFVNAVGLLIQFSIGVYAGVQIITHAADTDLTVRAASVWAILLSWFILHWMFAQVYRAKDRDPSARTLRFPGTEHPGIVDYVYYAFTIAVCFEVSDVSITDTRTRWTLTVHSIMSFFFNGLIVVLAFHAITGF